jgi:hypothetical protein
MFMFKSGGDLHNRGMRPSPKESATLFRVGHRQIGQDGNMYEIIMASNGVKRWSKVSSAAPSKTKMRSMPVISAAKTKKAKKPTMATKTTKAKTTKAKTTKAKSKKSTANTGRAWTLDRMYSSKEEYEKSYKPKRKKPAKKHARQKSA